MTTSLDSVLLISTHLNFMFPLAPSSSLPRYHTNFSSNLWMKNEDYIPVPYNSVIKHCEFRSVPSRYSESWENSEREVNGVVQTVNQNLKKNLKSRTQIQEVPEVCKWSKVFWRREVLNLWLKIGVGCKDDYLVFVCLIKY